MEKNTHGADGGAPDERWDLAEYALSFTSGRHTAPRPAVARCYGFSVGTWNFLLEEGQAAELVSQPVYTPLPNTPDHCLGLANVRGNIIPFYTLRSFFSSVEKPSAEQQRYALLVGDVVNGVLLAIDAKPLAINRDTLVQNSVSTSRLGQMAPLIKQQYTSDARDWLMLDSVKLLQFLAVVDAE